MANMHDVCDRKQHTLYLQIVVMKHLDPVPQYRMQVSNMSQIISYFPYFTSQQQISLYEPKQLW